jgi:hypothetical protein
MSTKENVDITIPSPIQRVLDKTRELQKEIKEVGQGSIKEMFEAIFKQAPAVLAVKWTQYTPHFNDGEPCVFNVNEPEVQFAEGTFLAKAHEEGRSYPEQDEYADGEEFYDKWTFRVQQKTVADLINEVYTVFQEIDQVMQAVFGDGVQVTVTRDGDVEIDEYDHD